MNALTPAETFTDRRQYPRLNLDVPLQVQYKQGKQVAARLHDISPDGLQIRCGREAAAQIHPSGKFIHADAQPVVVVSFQLPYSKTSRTIIVKCAICYFALLAGAATDDVAFGLCFRQFKGNCRHDLTQFFLNELEPP